jgi:hypothetical protein
VDLVATPEDVANLTGAVVTEPQLIQAQGLVEVSCGRPWETWANASTIDRRKLKLAVVYQSAWMLAHPEAFTSLDATSFSQLDQSVTVRDSDSLTLSPLAKKLLRRLSWRRSVRTIPLTTSFQRTPDPDDDHAGHWSAL